MASGRPAHSADPSVMPDRWTKRWKHDCDLCCLKQLRQHKSVISVAWRAHVCVHGHLCMWSYLCCCLPRSRLLLLSQLTDDISAALMPRVCPDDAAGFHRQFHCVSVCKRDRMRWSRTDTLTIWQRKCCNQREVHLPPFPLSLSLMLFVLLRWHDTLSPSPPPLPPVFSAEADALSITVSLSPSHPPHCFDCVNGRMGEGWMKADGLDGGV